MERSDAVALILEACKAKGLTWKDLAAKVGNALPSLAFWMSGAIARRGHAEQERFMDSYRGPPATSGRGPARSCRAATRGSTCR